MKHPKAAFIGAALGLTALTTAFVAANPGEADAQGRRNVITFTHPATVNLMPGGSRERTIDCDLLQTVPGSANPNARFARCEWYEQLDPNGQDFCSATDNLPSDPQARVNAFSQATLQAVMHAADFHGDCRAQAGRILQQQGRNPAAQYGANWARQTSCTIVQARDQCYSAMGLTR